GRARGSGRPRGDPRGFHHEGSASGCSPGGHLRHPRGTCPEGRRDRRRGRQPRCGRRADRPGPETARGRRRTPAPGRYPGVRDERQPRRAGCARAPDPAGGVQGHLKAIVAGLLLRGIEPILMTEPRWADDAPVNGLSESPNVRLASYVEACRAVATECRVPLVDHFARWTEARSKDQALGDWTTDGCEPTPRGHWELAEALRPALRDALRPAPRPVAFTTRLETVLTHDDGRSLWYHPRAAAIPKAAGDADPGVLMTLQKHLRTSDHYSG